jgi:AcrR family transcriptional regulator
MATVKESRRKRSQATRDAIITAAQAIFIENGYHGATIASIADRAGVAPQTVYFVFHTKAELISAVIDTAVVGSDDPLPPQAQPWWQAMLDEPDATKALEGFVRGAGDPFARASSISEVLRAAALTDTEVRATHEHHERLRREAFGEVLDTLAVKAPLRAGMSRDHLLDVFLTVYGDSSYYHLTIERGWTHDEVMNWLSDVLPTILFEAER